LHFLSYERLVKNALHCLTQHHHFSSPEEKTRLFFEYLKFYKINNTLPLSRDISFSSSTTD